VLFDPISKVLMFLLYQSIDSRIVYYSFYDLILVFESYILLWSVVFLKRFGLKLVFCFQGIFSR